MALQTDRCSCFCDRMVVSAMHSSSLRIRERLPTTIRWSDAYEIMSFRADSDSAFQGQEEAWWRILWFRFQSNEYLYKGLKGAWYRGFEIIKEFHIILAKQLHESWCLRYANWRANPYQAIRAVKTISKSQMKNIERFKQVLCSEISILAELLWGAKRTESDVRRFPETGVPLVSYHPFFVGIFPNKHQAAKKGYPSGKPHIRRLPSWRWWTTPTSSSSMSPSRILGLAIGFHNSCWSPESSCVSVLSPNC